MSNVKAHYITLSVLITTTILQHNTFVVYTNVFEMIIGNVASIPAGSNLYSSLMVNFGTYSFKGRSKKKTTKSVLVCLIARVLPV